MTEQNYQSNFMQTYAERGFMHQCTADIALDKALKEAETEGEPLTCYIGFDCTASSLHVGSLIQIMILRHLQKAGHKPIILLGGGTTKVGDPSGKDKSRQLLDEDGIEQNKNSLKQVFKTFLSFGDNASDAMIVDNAEWLDSLNYIDFLREYGRHFSVNRMLSMESVKMRLEREQPLSFLEFNYMILQAYDFVELNKRYGCRVQIGGSDQWGNIINGVELNRRLYVVDAQNDDEIDMARELFGLTSPLLTTSSGAKMGKTADGAIWLDSELLSAYDYWQFWRNTEDADVVKFLKLFTELSLEEIATLEAYEGAQINEAKKILATEATAMLHGREAAKQAAKTAQQTFEQGMASANLPEVALATDELSSAIPAFKLFHMAGLADSGGAARRLIRDGGARINDEQIKDENRELLYAEHERDGAVKLSAGKKKHILLKRAG